MKVDDFDSYIRGRDETYPGWWCRGHLRAAVRTSPCVRMMRIRRKSRGRARAGREPMSPAPTQNTAPPPGQEEEPHTR